MNILKLSYDYINEFPVYGGIEKLKFNVLKSIDANDSSNSFTFEIGNHWGTHIDCPSHFFKNGKKISEYSISDFYFKNICIINLDIDLGGIIDTSMLDSLISDEDEILILKSNWSKIRSSNISNYIFNSPIILPEVGLYIRKNFPNIRVIGFDWISMTSKVNREIGVEAHFAFLNPDGLNDPVLILEDMNLDFEDSIKFKKLIVSPLFADKLDSSICSVFGIYE